MKGSSGGCTLSEGGLASGGDLIEVFVAGVKGRLPVSGQMLNAMGWGPCEGGHGELEVDIQKMGMGFSRYVQRKPV